MLLGKHEIIGHGRTHTHTHTHTNGDHKHILERQTPPPGASTLHNYNIDG